MVQRGAFVLMICLGLVACNDSSSSSPDPQAEVIKSSFETQTADGWTIALRRYQNSLGTQFCEPVILSSGFLENGNVFDLFPGHSLAEYLALKGYEVWTYDIRGTGESEKSDVFDLFGWDYSIDHFVFFDTPAAVQCVMSESGCDQVLWVGHSLGSLMLYGFLETNDPTKVKAAVSICGVGTFSADQEVIEDFASTFLNFGLLLGPILPPNMPIALRYLLDELLGDELALWAAVSYLLSSEAGSLFWNPENMNPNLVYLILQNVFSDTSSNVLSQYFSWTVTLDCAAHGVTYSPQAALPGEATVNPFEGAVDPPITENIDGSVTVGEGYSFTGNLWRIETPLLVLSGEVDRMVPPANAVAVFEAISSPDKSYGNCSVAEGHSIDYGHMDTVVGLHAEDEVFPLVEEWLRERATRR